MKRAFVVVFATGVWAILAAVPAGGGVHVDAPDVKETLVAFQTADMKYITASPSNSLDTAGVKIGAKQKFTVIDLNGGELEDGHGIKIRYTPTTSGVPNTSKSTYWIETKTGIKRGHDADIFKAKKVDAKYAFQAPSGKYLAAPAGSGGLGLTDKLEAAMLLDIVDPAKLRSKSKTPKQPADSPAPTPPEKPATE